MSYISTLYFSEIQDERDYQNGLYGHLDKTNTPYHWATYINKYSTRNLGGDPNKVDLNLFRQDMIKVASLAIAAIQQIDNQ